MEISPAVQEFIYRETRANQVEISRWEIAQTTSQIAVKRIGGLLEGSDRALFSPEWKLREWEGVDRFHIEAQTEKLHFSNNEKKSAQISSNSLPWLQDLTFALKPFINSDQKELTFFVVNPNDQAKIELVAKKEQIEEISIPSGSTQALRITFTLAGWKKYLWKGVGHFDPKEGYMLRFEANSGPGTSNIIKELLSKNSKAD